MNLTQEQITFIMKQIAQYGKEHTIPTGTDFDEVEEFVSESFCDFFDEITVTTDIDIQMIGYELMYQGYKQVLRIIGETFGDDKIPDGELLQ